MAETLKIDRLGHRGDGVADGPSGPVYVPLVLPGEVVEVERVGSRGRPTRIIDPSPVRISASCGHFGECGGCSLQHMRSADYLEWKREQVRLALVQRGVEFPVEQVVPVHARTRRRAVLTARRIGPDVTMGYHERLSNHVVGVSDCAVVVPQIERALPGLAAWLQPLIPRQGEARIAVTAAENGLDVALETPRPPPTKAITKLIAKCPPGLNLARLSIAAEPVLVNAEPFVEVEGIPVRLPPGAFLQAAKPAEEVMARLVLEGVGGARRVADLYAGIGTFALRLARLVPVLAVESEAHVLAALGEAARRASGLKPIETLRRDLDRHPLSPKELERFDAAVFDPPRGGAKSQAAELARSKVRRVVAVSCNAATLGRDIRILLAGGYGLMRIVPVDQFLFSHHIEVVALLERQ